MDMGKWLGLAAAAAKSLCLMMLLGAGAPVWAVEAAAEGPKSSEPKAPPVVPWHMWQMPKIPHEQSPTSWPQADYFAEALKTVKKTPDQAFSSLLLRPDRIPAGAMYITVPVQTQAFGFSPAFRALMGAELDRQLASREVVASRQTDIVDVQGPFVRRFDEAALTRLAADQPGRPILALYIGHDGIDQAFVDFTVGVGPQRVSVHRAVALPAKPQEAFEALAKMLPTMLDEAGLARAKTRPAPPAFECTAAAWSLADLPPDAPEADQACAALVVGTLLPDYGTEVVLQGTPMRPPARLAWLARAHALSRAGSSDTAQAVRELSWMQLYLDAEPVLQASGRSSSGDPVIRRVAGVLSAWDSAGKSPVNSSRGYVDKVINELAKGLSPFTAAALTERVRFQESFWRVDICEMEKSFPGPLMRLQCGSEGRVASSRASQPMQLLLQEWRIAQAYKALSYQGVAQGRPVQELLQAMPADIARHPFIQRLRYVVRAPETSSSSMEQQLAALRSNSEAFLRSTINLQFNDVWLAGHSLSEHFSSRNMVILNDGALVADQEAERPLVRVLHFDRFPGPSLEEWRRKPGDPAFFMPMVMPTPEQMATMPRPSMVKVPDAKELPLSLQIFQPTGRFLELPSMDDFEAALKQAPHASEFRARLAVMKLQSGEPLSRVVKFLEEAPKDQRNDSRISQSHAAAMSGHVLYLAGEAQAARPFYDQASRSGTGSDSDMMARVRLRLIDGKPLEAIDPARARLARYPTDFTRRDAMGLLFLGKQPAQAWSVFDDGVWQAEQLEFWLGAAAGHRLDGKTLPQVRQWLRDRKLEKLQVEFTDIEMVYLHLLAVLDRMPSTEDIKLLSELRSNFGMQNGTWAVSAILNRGILSKQDPAQTITEVRKAATNLTGGDTEFMLPAYVWTMGQVDKNDVLLERVRKVTVKDGFDRMLAKSLLLALDGDTAGSLQLFKVTRFELSNLTWGPSGGLVSRQLPVQYQYAQAGYLMYLKTGQAAYREEVLHFLEGYQKAFPYMAWAHALQAVLEPDVRKKDLAICRARALDKDSHYLSQAKMAKSHVCPARLW